MSRRRRSALIGIGALAALAIVCVLVAALAFRSYQIPGKAMTPTVKAGEWIWTRPVGHEAKVHRGEIVLLRPPATVGFKKVLARVVAVGGDTVGAAGGHLILDGRRADESYLPPRTDTPDLDRITVPMGTVYVLGDNRVDSEGSRFWGPIPRANVLEQVVHIGGPSFTVLFWITVGLCMLFVVVLIRRPSTT